MSSEEAKHSIDDVLVDDFEADESSDDEGEWQQVYGYTRLYGNRRGLVLFGGGPEGGLHMNSNGGLFWWGRTWGKPALIDENPMCDQRLEVKVTEDGVFVKLVTDTETLYRRLKIHNAKMYNLAMNGLKYHDDKRLKRQRELALKCQRELAMIQTQTFLQASFPVPGLLG